MTQIHCDHYGCDLSEEACARRSLGPEKLRSEHAYEVGVELSPYHHCCTCAEGRERAARLGITAPPGRRWARFGTIAQPGMRRVR